MNNFQQPSFNKKQQLSQNFQRLHEFNDINTYEFFQNLVIYLSAKEIIEGKEKRNTNSKTFEELFTSELDLSNIIADQQIEEDFLEAAYLIMPSLTRQFDYTEIKNKINELVYNEKGLEECYAFLRINIQKNKNKLIINFEAETQKFISDNPFEDDTIYTFSPPLIISIYHIGENNFEFILTFPSNKKQKIFNLKLEIETHGFICFSNEEYQIFLNREDPFFEPQIRTISVVYTNPTSTVTYCP